MGTPRASATLPAGAIGRRHLRPSATPKRPERLHEAVAGHVERQRRLAGLSQADVARILGISQQSASRKLRATVPFDLDELATLAAFFRLSVCDLIRPAEREMAVTQS